MSSAAAPLWLDHASVQVPDLGAAVEHLGRRLGLRATVSHRAPERHSRVYLDRSYVEVSARPGGTGWRASMFFLRFEDDVALRRHLERAGLTYRFGTYEGVDGTWDDVEVDAGDVRLPILVRRTAPPELARDWPPALTDPQPCGARTLAEVHVGVPSLDDALDPHARLLALREVPAPTPDPMSGRPSARLPTRSGHIVLLDRGTGGIERIVLGVASDATVRGQLIRHQGDPVAWLDPVETFGLQLGFVRA